MPITEAQLKEIYHKARVQANIISQRMDHNDWYPCGRAYLVVKGTSPLVKAIKVNPNAGLSAMKTEHGYWVSPKIGWNDAFECQSMRYSEAVHEAFQLILKDYGIESYVGSYID